MKRTTIDPETLNRPDGNDLASNYSLHDLGEAYFRGRAEGMGLQCEHWGIDMRNDTGAAIKDDKMDLRLWEPRDGASGTPPIPDDFTGDLVAQSCYEGDSVTHTKQWKLRGVVDVKTKGNMDWLCGFNVRHFADYARWADHYDVPVTLYFTHVDTDEGVTSGGDSQVGVSEKADRDEVGNPSILTPVTTDWDYERVIEHFERGNGHTLEWGELKRVVSEATIADRVSRAPDGNPVVWIDDEWQRDFEWFEEVVTL